MKKFLALFYASSLIFMFIFSETSYAIEEASKAFVAKVVWIKGTLKAAQPNKEARILQKDSTIYLNDTLITDTKSKAQIVFTDNTLMTFRENTQFYIDQYQYKPKAEGGSAGKYVMNLIEGGFRTITGAIAKRNPSDYQINTPVATIGVRGTDYAVYLNRGQLYMGYYDGTPCVSSGGGSLCLSEKIRYSHVPSKDVLPVPMTTPPPVFKEKLDVVPATISSPPPSAPSEGGLSDSTKDTKEIAPASSDQQEEASGTTISNDSDSGDKTSGKGGNEVKEITTEKTTTNPTAPLSNFCIQ